MESSQCAETSARVVAPQVGPVDEPRTVHKRRARREALSPLHEHVLTATKALPIWDIAACPGRQSPDCLVAGTTPT